MPSIPYQKQTPWTVRSSFQSDWQIRMTVSSTPPLPHPPLTAPVSHRALAQSTEIVSCLFLNTHLYLTAYWVSISPNVHYVWMCSRVCVCECVCVSFSSGFTSPVRHACHVRLSFPSWRCACPSSSRGDGKGWVPGRGGLVVGGLKTHMHPHPVSWWKIPGVGWLQWWWWWLRGSRGGNRLEEVSGGVGGAGVEKYNFSSSIAVSVITACHA